MRASPSTWSWRTSAVRGSGYNGLQRLRRGQGHGNLERLIVENSDQVEADEVKGLDPDEFITIKGVTDRLYDQYGDLAAKLFETQPIGRTSMPDEEEGEADPS